MCCCPDIIFREVNVLHIIRVWLGPTVQSRHSMKNLMDYKTKRMQLKS